MIELTGIEHYIQDVLTGKTPDWDATWSPDAFIRACQIHGTAGLIAHACAQGELKLPSSVQGRLREVLDGHKVFELLHCEQLRRLLDEFESRQIISILLKGTALAYSVFPIPCLRSRGDTDLIISEADRDIVFSILEEQGYTAKLSSNTEILMYQQSYLKTDQFGVTHMIDVHWRINNRQAFATAFTWEELSANSITLPQLSLTARGLNPVYQFLHLCIHRVGHLDKKGHANEMIGHGDRLLWLYEISLVGESLDENDWRSIHHFCRQNKLCAIVLDTITTTRALFDLDVPASVLEGLSKPNGNEPSRLLLKGSFFASFLADILALPGLTLRIQLVAEHLLPPADYMLLRYDKQSHWWLPLLYARRIIGFRPDNRLADD